MSLLCFSCFSKGSKGRHSGIKSKGHHSRIKFMGLRSARVSPEGLELETLPFSSVVPPKTPPPKTPPLKTPPSKAPPLKDTQETPLRLPLLLGQWLQQCSQTFNSCDPRMEAKSKEVGSELNSANFIYSYLHAG